MLKLACQEQLLPGDDLRRQVRLRPPRRVRRHRAAGQGRRPLRGAPARAARRRPRRRRDAHRLPGHRPLHRRLRRRPAPRRDRPAALPAQRDRRAGRRGRADPGELGHVQPAPAAVHAAAHRRRTTGRCCSTRCATLAEHAQREGVWLALEALNRYEDYMLNRLEQVADLAGEVARATGTTSVRACADFFHLNIEEDDLPKAIVAAGPLISHVHVDDSNRLQPGTGHLDFAGAFGALRGDRLRRLAHAGVPAARRRPRPPCRRPRRSCAGSRRPAVRDQVQLIAYADRLGGSLRGSACGCSTGRWPGRSAACTCCRSTGPTTARTPASTPTTTWPSTRAWARGTTSRRWRAGATSSRT